MSAVQQMFLWLAGVAKMPASALLHYSLNSDSKEYSNSINGTDTAISYVAGKKWNAASFNGTSSQIAFPIVPFFQDMAEDFWISIWLNPTSLWSDRVFFSSTAWRLNFWTNSAWKLWFLTQPWNIWYETWNSLSVSSWQHFFFRVYRFSNVNYIDIYKDNVFVQTITMWLVMWAWLSSESFFLWRHYTTSYYWNGLIDHVTIGKWNLTATERWDLFRMPEIDTGISFDAYGWLAVGSTTITTNYVQSWSHTNNWKMLTAVFIPAAVWWTPVNNVSATYNGVAMTRLGSSYFFYLANPPIGTYTLAYTVNFNSSLWSCAVVYHSASYKGTTTAPTDYTSAGSGTYQVSITKTIPSDKSWHIGLGSVNNFRTLVPNVNCTLRWHQTLGVSVYSDSGIVDSIWQGNYPGSQMLQIQNNDGNNSGAQLESFMLSL